MKQRYVSDNKEWMLDWDYENNSKLPSEVTIGSRQRVFWKCHVCGGSWETAVKDRRGCPYCNNFKALPGYNDLATLFPEISLQWDYEKNGALQPCDVTIGSQKKVYWKCENGHSWDALVRSRTLGQGCPYCNNRRILSGYNDLITLNPELAREWCYEKNGELKPSDVGAGSKKKVWWKCKEGHTWEARVLQRNRGTGCPICANRIIVKSYNDFASEHPELLSEWDYEKNEKAPSEYACFSSQKVWWICKQGHSWKAVIGDRSKGNGCPKCSEERRVSFPEKAILYYISRHIEGVEANYREKRIAPYELDIFIPQYSLAVEYDGVYGHSGKNGIARDKRKNALCDENGIKLIRIREYGCGSTNDTSIDYLLDEKNDVCNAIKFVFEYLYKHFGVNCGFHSEEVDTQRDAAEIYSLIAFSEKENSLLKKAPEIAKMWHPTKNGNVNPEYVSVGSQRKFWWLGSCGHEWRSSVQYEISSGKCPYCTGKRVLIGFNDLKTTNMDVAKEWDYQKNGDVTPETVTAGSGKKVWWRCEKGHSWKASIVSRNRGNGCPICANRIALQGYNDVMTMPELKRTWNYSKNQGIDPTKISIGTEKAFWWLCDMCGYEWKASVSRRVRGSGCPECSRLIRAKNARQTMVNDRGSLAKNCPELMEEWDWDQNKLDPDHIVSGYTKKVWWKCKSCKKSWEATVISRRAGCGCPYCADRKRALARQDKLLHKKTPITITNPDIMKDWDYEKNKDFNPERLTSGSGKRVFWICSKCGYRWDAVISERTRGRCKCRACTNMSNH